MITSPSKAGINASGLAHKLPTKRPSQNPTLCTDESASVLTRSATHKNDYSATNSTSVAGTVGYYRMKEVQLMGSKA
jgi:hypothetical protein